MPNEFDTPQEQISWLISNTSAISTIIRALAEANADNPTFVDALKKQYDQRDANFNASVMADKSITEFKSAVKALVPPSVRVHLN